MEKKFNKQVPKSFEGYATKKWTEDELKQYLFVDLWDTFYDLKNKETTINMVADQEQKKVFEVNANYSYWLLNMLYKSAYKRLYEIAIERKDKSLKLKLIELKKRAKKEGV